MHPLTGQPDVKPSQRLLGHQGHQYTQLQLLGYPCKELVKHTHDAYAIDLLE